jgi:hypothetical protein
MHHESTHAEALIGGQTEELAKKAITLALNGDVIALRLCLERNFAASP